jgi:ketosteroid isomerase-like protein
MDEDLIRELVQARADALGAKDAKAMVATFAEEAVEFTLAPPLQQPLDARNAAPVEQWLAGFSGPMSMEIRDLQVTAGQDVAFCTSLNCLTATPVGSQESFSLWFRSTLGLRKLDGEWQVTHNHESVPFDMDGSFRASVGLRP